MTGRAALIARLEKLRQSIDEVLDELAAEGAGRKRATRMTARGLDERDGARLMGLLEEHLPWLIDEAPRLAQMLRDQSLYWSETKKVRPDWPMTFLNGFIRSEKRRLGDVLPDVVEYREERRSKRDLVDLLNREEAEHRASGRTQPIQISLEQFTNKEEF